jgi:hypothetical protein
MSHFRVVANLQIHIVDDIALYLEGIMANSDKPNHVLTFFCNANGANVN